MKNHTLHGKSASAKSGWLIVILWGLGLIGICGVHRLYMGRRLSGMLQLISLGGWIVAWPHERRARCAHTFVADIQQKNT